MFSYSGSFAATYGYGVKSLSSGSKSMLSRFQLVCGVTSEFLETSSWFNYIII